MTFTAVIVCPNLVHWNSRLFVQGLCVELFFKHILEKGKTIFCIQKMKHWRVIQRTFWVGIWYFYLREQGAGNNAYSCTVVGTLQPNSANQQDRGWIESWLLEILLYIVQVAKHCCFANDISRKIEIVQFASRTRQQFVRLLALVKWAASAERVDKCQVSAFFVQVSIIKQWRFNR